MPFTTIPVNSMDDSMSSNILQPSVDSVPDSDLNSLDDLFPQRLDFTATAIQAPSSNTGGYSEEAGQSSPGPEYQAGFGGGWEAFLTQLPPIHGYGTSNDPIPQ
ncbi:hypothetical protein FRC11_003565, partial [Ceratobasidium sp. 423]